VREVLVSKGPLIDSCWLMVRIGSVDEAYVLSADTPLALVGLNQLIVMDNYLSLDNINCIKSRHKYW
jgi:hypothetical protein